MPHSPSLCNKTFSYWRDLSVLMEIVSDMTSTLVVLSVLVMLPFSMAVILDPALLTLDDFHSMSFVSKTYHL